MRQTVKIAAVQTAPVAFDLAQSIDKVAHFTAQAAKSGADLVVFPYVFPYVSKIPTTFGHC